MTNLTIAIDEDLLRAARVKAVQQGTSVNEICRQAIARYAAPEQDAGDFLSRLQAVAAQIPQTASAWPSRQAMYDEVLAERLPPAKAAR